MAKYDYMLQHARRNVWCNPVMDNQHVLCPTRLTSGHGALNQFYALERFIPTPREKVHTHVFQVGQLSPGFLNLIERNPTWQAEKWFTFAEAMNQLGLYINIYNQDGVNIPRFTSYFMFTREKCLVFAIERDPRIQYNLNEDKIYFRFYTNAFFSNERGNKNVPKVEIKGYNISTMANILAAQADYRRSVTRKGYTEAFVNGFLVPEVAPGTVKIGDLVEWVYDASVKRIVNFRVGDLIPFNSEMDNKQKLILHYNVPGLDQIDYQDDLDVSIQLPDNVSGRKGRYYPKHLPMSMRNLTHRDYSVVGDFVSYISRRLLADTQAPVEYADMRLILKVREGGYARKLIQDNQRIFELYKLKDEDVLKAMSGIISFPPVWHANNLEKSAYPAIMGALYQDITIRDVENAYGYNSISKILADTPTKGRQVGNIKVADVPERLQKDATFYEFDVDGRMVHWAYHDNDDDYELARRDAVMVEGIAGRGSDRVPAVIGKSGFKVPEGELRVYYRDEPPGSPVGKWQDITGDDRYSISNGIFLWLAPTVNFMVMVRSAEGFLAYDAVMLSARGLFNFQLTESIMTDTGIRTVPMEVPGGSLQIWLNNRNLVRNVDYFVNFPNVYINNYPFLVQPSTTATQRLHIRSSGFCDENMQMEKIDTGFVQHGAISNNGRYDLFDDKVQHISVGGAVMHKADLKFYETLPGDDIVNPLNGRPYQVEDIAVPLGDYVESKTWNLRKKSLAIDKMVSDYMTLYFSGKKDLHNSSSVTRWTLVSPFFSHLIYLLKNNVFNTPADVLIPDEQVLKMCAPYETLFDYDPLNEKYKLIPKFVLIRPHALNQPINLTQAQYRLLLSIVRLYGRDRVSINTYVTFTV